MESIEDDFEKIISGEICPYCHCETKLVLGDEIYPHRVNITPREKFLDKNYYVCTQNPDHYVGTYSDNQKSLGRLADAELRKWKNLGHKAFDPLWKEKPKFFESQQRAYDWLSEKMNLPLRLTHFGMFTIEQCKQAIELCEELRREREPQES